MKVSRAEQRLIDYLDGLSVANGEHLMALAAARAAVVEAAKAMAAGPQYASPRFIALERAVARLLQLEEPGGYVMGSTLERPDA